ncbi:MAG: glutamine-hydrolyzing GMP synthase [Anaerolineae bacterium]|nr:glutamine-hydrolyzing GMP synthase [Anaerolineae bacterium]
MTLKKNTIAILDFGSQYTQLIARRVREAHVYCELFPWETPAEDVLALEPRGFVLSGGPASVYASDAPHLPEYVLEQALPVLGICYGMQLLAHHLGGHVARAQKREYGPAEVEFVGPENPLFGNLKSQITNLNVWMSHGDSIATPPSGFEVLARSANSPVAAMGDLARGLYGLQFHPEVVHTERGEEILRSFAVDVCGCAPEWTPAAFIAQALASIREQVGAGRVVCGLSGGIDSAVAATLVHRAVGNQLTCIFVNHGLMRKGEPDQVVRTFRDRGMQLVPVDATEEFLSALSGVTDPEQKRCIIGERFIRIFEQEAAKLGDGASRVRFLAQGTLYPDVIESAATGRDGAAVIKHHHNVGGLPEDMQFELVEPVRDLFKDEVRQIGKILGLPHELIGRHPFPGPGLAVRILGEITWERLETLRDADEIFLQELESSRWYDRVGQAFAVLLPEALSTGVAGDESKFGQTIVLRAIETDDFMTASPALLPYALLTKVSTRILNEIDDITRVVYDLSTKPPATIEWL